LAAKITSIIADINDIEKLKRVFKEYQPEIVFHMAAQSLVRRSYRDPVDTFSANVMGTVHLFEAIRAAPTVKACINITTDKCYENKEWFWGYREVDRLGGRDPYSASKACAELITAAYRQSFFSKNAAPLLASARAGNVIGGGDWSEDRLLPDIARAIVAKRPIIIRNPNGLRPWQHVLDALHGYLLLGQALWEQGAVFADAWNFGPNDNELLSVIDLTRAIVRRWGEGEVSIQSEANAVHEADLLRLDSSKARTLLQWQPLLSTYDAIDFTVDWYSAHLKNKLSAVTLTDQQIDIYLQRSNVSYD
jgi:CDP-glucose 4,6-dehydratase